MQGRVDEVGHRQGQGWRCGKDYRAWQEGARGSTYTVPVEDIGQIISSQLHVRPQLRPRPAHSHLACGDRLELKVPAAALHHIGLLCPEDAHPVPARLALHQTYTWGQSESERLWREWVPKYQESGGRHQRREGPWVAWGKRASFLVLQEKNWGISD